MDQDLFIIHRRNILLAQMLAVFFAFDIITSITSGGNSSGLLVFIILVGLFILGVSFYLIKKKKLTRFLMYFLITVIWLSLAVYNYIDKDIVNMFFLIMIPVFCALYPSRILVAFGTILSASTFVFFSFQNEEIMGPNFQHHDLFYYVIIFGFVGTVGALQERFSGKLRRESNKRAEEATSAKDEAMKMVVRLQGTQDATNDFSNKLNKTTNETVDSSVNILESFTQINLAINEQNNSIRGLLQNANEITDQAESINNSSEVMKRKSEASTTTIENASDSVVKLQSEMNNLEDVFEESLHTTFVLDNKTSEIRKITETMESLTNEINLLSLNASIEAARAGESGKGFAVVASEVRKLAEGAKGSTEEIKHILLEIQNTTKVTVEKMEKSKESLYTSKVIGGEVKDAFESIYENNTDIVSEISSINEKIFNLKSSIENVNENIANISSASEQNSSSFNEINFSFELIVNSIKEIANEFEKLKEKTEFEK